VCVSVRESVCETKGLWLSSMVRLLGLVVRGVTLFRSFFESRSRSWSMHCTMLLLTREVIWHEQHQLESQTSPIR